MQHIMQRGCHAGWANVRLRSAFLLVGIGSTYSFRACDDFPQIAADISWNMSCCRLQLVGVAATAYLR